MVPDSTYGFVHFAAGKFTNKDCLTKIGSHSNSSFAPDSLSISLKHECSLIDSRFLVVKSEILPGLHDEAFGAKFSVLFYFVVFEHAEGFIDATFAAYVFGVEDVS